MEVKYDIGLEDLIAYNLHHANTSPTLRRAQFRHRFWPPAVWVLVGALVAFGQHDRGGIAFACGMLVVSIGWIALAPSRWMRLFRKNVRKLYAEGQNRTVLGAHRLAIMPDGILNQSETSETRTSWSAIEKLDETADYLYLFVGAGQAHIVPKRAFASEAEARHFLDTARSLREQAAGLAPATGASGGLLP